MKIGSIGGVLCLVAVGALTGCRTPEPVRYADGRELRIGSVDQLTASEQLGLAEDALRNLKTDWETSQAHKRLRDRIGNRLPVLVVQPLEGYAPLNRNHTVLIYRNLQKGLRRSGLFDVVDDRDTKNLIDRQVAGSDDLGENGDGLQPIGTFRSPDLVMMGDLRCEDDGGAKMYCLSLRVVDAKTRAEYWSDIVRRTKLQ